MIESINPGDHDDLFQPSNQRKRACSMDILADAAYNVTSNSDSLVTESDNKSESKTSEKEALHLLKPESNLEDRIPFPSSPRRFGRTRGATISYSPFNNNSKNPESLLGHRALSWLVMAADDEQANAELLSNLTDFKVSLIHL